MTEDEDRDFVRDAATGRFLPTTAKGRAARLAQALFGEPEAVDDRTEADFERELRERAKGRHVRSKAVHRNRPGY